MQLGSNPLLFTASLYNSELKLHCVSKKYAPWCLITTLTTVVERLSKIFRQLIRKKILYVCIYIEMA